MNGRIGMSLRCCLKTASDGADVTWGGWSFHVLVPEILKAHLLTIERWTDVTSR